MKLNLGLSIPTEFWIGLAIAAFGLFLVFIANAAKNAPKFLEVPEGIQPDRFYRQWKEKRLLNKVSKGFVFFTGLAGAMIAAGILVMFWGFSR